MTRDNPVLRPRPAVLCVLDGWGHRAEAPDNAIRLASTPNWDRLLHDSPHALLEASELFVGLPRGQMGNSEVGHTNLGAGRVVMQELPRIDLAIKNGNFAANPALAGFIAALKKTGGAAHILGLLSPGGVHSHQDHIVALARTVATAGIWVAIHAFFDGRDTPPRSALTHLAKFESAIDGLQNVRIATVGGRYYAMDRDQRWDRVRRAYDVMTEAKAKRRPMPRARSLNPMPPARAMSSCRRSRLGITAACATATVSSWRISAPTACAKS